MALADLIGLKDLVGQVVSEVGKHIPTPIDQQKKLELEMALEQTLATSLAAQNQAQAEVNKVEASSPRLFIAGWRPAIGWTCAVAIAYAFLVYPILKAFWSAAVMVDMENLWPLIIGMLGVGTMRTYEKKMGVQNKH
jgi:hypothetical protein